MPATDKQKSDLRNLLKNNSNLRELFTEELAEREGIVAEKLNEFENFKTIALEFTIESWIVRLKK